MYTLEIRTFDNVVSAMSQQVSPEELVHSFISTELLMADNQLERILVEHAPARNQSDANWKLYFEPWKPSEECGECLIVISSSG